MVTYGLVPNIGTAASGASKPCMPAKDVKTKD